MVSFMKTSIDEQTNNKYHHSSHNKRGANMTDKVIQATFLSADEKRYERHKTSKKALRKAHREAMATPLPDGPCCHRCHWWRPPGPQDDYGVCASLAIVVKRQRGGYEPGTTLTVKDAVKESDLHWSYLRTRGFFVGCKGYQHKEGSRCSFRNGPAPS